MNPKESSSSPERSDSVSGERSGKRPPAGIIFFTEGPIGQHINRMAIPMTWGMLASVLAALADTYFLAQLGTAHLAAITFTFPVVMLVMNLSLGLASGFSSLLARALGEGNMIKVENLTISAMLMSAAIIFALSIVGYLTIDPLFTALGAGEQTLPLIRDFMSIWYFSMILVVTPIIGNFALRATGNPKTASYVMIVSALVNVLLDPIFIFGFGFIPEMGIKGAALAGVVSRLAAFLVMLYMLTYRTRLITFKLPALKTMFESWKEIFHIGAPLALTNMVTPLSAALVTRLLAQYGENIVAGFGIAARIEALAIIPLIAVGSSFGPISGQNFGAAKYARIVELLKYGFIFAALYGVSCTVLMAIFHQSLPGFFNSNPEVVYTAGLYLLVVPVGFMGLGITMVVGASFTGMGNPKPSMLMSLLRLSVVYLPLAYIGSILFGPVGIFGANALANLSVALGAGVFIAFQARKAVVAGKIDRSTVSLLVPKALVSEVALNGSILDKTNTANKD
jgi:putative MATE family efflux protein